MRLSIVLLAIWLTSRSIATPVEDEPGSQPLDYNENLNPGRWKGIRIQVGVSLHDLTPLPLRKGDVKWVFIHIVGGWRFSDETWIQWIEMSNPPKEKCEAKGDSSDSSDNDDDEISVFGSAIGQKIAEAFYEHLYLYLAHNGFDRKWFAYSSAIFSDANNGRGYNRGAVGLWMHVSPAFLSLQPRPHLPRFPVRRSQSECG